MSLEKINNMKGVTLIALTITIVVLAIIAGITVTAVTGEKSTIQEAKDAKASSEEESAKEQVQAAVLGCVKKDGSIDIEKLNKKLGTSTSITSLPAAVDINGVKLVIDKEGNTSESIGDKKVIFINDQYYTADINMTWEEWVAEGKKIDDWTIKIDDQGYLRESYTEDNGLRIDIYILNSSGSIVKKTDEIKDNEKYTKKVDLWY